MSSGSVVRRQEPSSPVGSSAGDPLTPSTAGSGRIRLRVPADPAFVGLPPLTASDVAERLGFSRREIDGLCAALDHSIAAILSLGGGTTRTLHVDFTLHPSRLEVELGTIEGGSIPAGTLRRLGPAVASLVSSFEPAGPRLRLSLVGPDAAAS